MLNSSTNPLPLLSLGVIGTHEFALTPASRLVDKDLLLGTFQRISGLNTDQWFVQSNNANSSFCNLTGSFNLLALHTFHEKNILYTEDNIVYLSLCSYHFKNYLVIFPWKDVMHL